MHRGDLGLVQLRNLRDLAVQRAIEAQWFLFRFAQSVPVVAGEAIYAFSQIDPLVLPKPQTPNLDDIHFETDTFLRAYTLRFFTGWIKNAIERAYDEGPSSSLGRLNSIALRPTAQGDDRKELMEQLRFQTFSALRPLETYADEIKTGWLRNLPADFRSYFTPIIENEESMVLVIADGIIEARTWSMVRRAIKLAQYSVNSRGEPSGRDASEQKRLTDFAYRFSAQLDQTVEHHLQRMWNVSAKRTYDASVLINARRREGQFWSPQPDSLEVELIAFWKSAHPPFSGYSDQQIRDVTNTLYGVAGLDEVKAIDNQIAKLSSAATVFGLA